MHSFQGGATLLSLGLIFLLYTMFVWWRDVLRESTLEGHHTKAVQLGPRYGSILFIVSEVMFLFAFFWGQTLHRGPAPSPTPASRALQLTPRPPMAGVPPLGFPPTSRGRTGRTTAVMTASSPVAATVAATVVAMATRTPGRTPVARSSAHAARFAAIGGTLPPTVATATTTTSAPTALNICFNFKIWEL